MSTSFISMLFYNLIFNFNLYINHTIVIKVLLLKVAPCLLSARQVSIKKSEISQKTKATRTCNFQTILVQIDVLYLIIDDI